MHHENAGFASNFDVMFIKFLTRWTLENTKIDALKYLEIEGGFYVKMSNIVNFTKCK